MKFTIHEIELEERPRPPGQEGFGMATLKSEGEPIYYDPDLIVLHIYRDVGLGEWLVDRWRSLRGYAPKTTFRAAA